MGEETTATMGNAMEKKEPGNWTCMQGSDYNDGPWNLCQARRDVRMCKMHEG